MGGATKPHITIGTSKDGELEIRLNPELGIRRQMLYRFVAPKGELRGDRQRMLDQRRHRHPASV